MLIKYSLKEKIYRYLPKSSLKLRLARGMFWALTGSVVAQALGMVSSIIVARLLGKTGLGEFGMILSTIGVLSVFAGLGLGVTATKSVAELRFQDKERAGKIIGICNLTSIISGGIAAFLLYIVAPILAEKFLNAPHLVLGIRLGAVYLFFNAIYSVQIGILSGLESFKTIAKITFAKGCANLPVIIIFVYFFGVLGAISAMILVSFIGCIFSLRSSKIDCIKNNIVPSYVDVKRELPVLWKFSLPVFLGSVIMGPVVWAANIMIVNQAGGYGALGLYNAARQWDTFLNFLPSILGTVLIPVIISNLKKKNEKLEVVNALLGWLFVVLLALPIIAFPEIIALLYGKDYMIQVYYKTLALVAFISCLIVYKSGLGRKIVVRNLMWWGFLNNSIWGVSLLISVYFLKTFGAIGLAMSYLIAYLVNTTIMIPLYIKKKVVPKYMLISKSIAVIWMVLIIQTVLTVMNTAIHIRIDALLVNLVIITIAYINIFKNYNR
ncbi:oligosaccharide flippase family protein [Elusimicrobiota bacterium]